MSAPVQPTPEPTYTGSVEAHRNLQGQVGLWELADALVVEVPQGTARTAFEGVRSACEAAGVKARGISALRQYRDTAVRFPPALRVPGVSFTAHRASKSADDPTRLLKDLAAVSGSENVSVQMVEDAIAALSPRPVIAHVPAVNLNDVSVPDLAATLVNRFLKSEKATITEVLASGEGIATAIQALAQGITTRRANTTRKAEQWGATPAQPKTTPAPVTQVSTDGAPILGGVRGRKKS